MPNHRFKPTGPKKPGRRLKLALGCKDVTLFGVQFHKQAERAMARGFDHMSACFVLFMAAFGCAFFAPYVIAEFGWVDGIGLIAAILASSLILAMPLRFAVYVHAGGITLRKSWLFIIYKRQSMGLEKTIFVVRGTGDWGDDGGWPIKHYCEVEPDGLSHQELLIGTPRHAYELSAFLTEQKQIFMSKSAQQEVQRDGHASGVPTR